MKTVILCGGMGTRLREETEYRPKPMVEIGGRPILWHIMKTYSNHGFRDFVLCLGYRGDVIREYFLNYEANNNDFTVCLGDKRRIQYHEPHKEQDFSVTLADTGYDTMTGGRIRRVSKYLDDDTFMLTYGDGLADVDLKGLLNFHKSHGRLATVTAVRPFSRFGLMDVDGPDGKVVRFAEKPEVEGWINGGFFVFSRKVLDLLSGDDCILERDPMERLAREGQLMAYRHDGFFYAMDTYREYKALNDMWASGKAPWKTWTD
ncbi:MAG: glucose-1-phosphate cytidylyltransferase [Lentisphaerae bacterium]|nr:glucose-1-phosphate cytidylyltransferase [Lentisphaerota bacterium]